MSSYGKGEATQGGLGEHHKTHMLNALWGTAPDKEEDNEKTEGTAQEKRVLEDPAYVAQQFNSQGKTKPMDSRDGEQPSSQTNHASMEPCDPVTPGPKLEPDTA